MVLPRYLSMNMLNTAQTWQQKSHLTSMSSVLAEPSANNYRESKTTLTITWLQTVKAKRRFIDIGLQFFYWKVRFTGPNLEILFVWQYSSSWHTKQQRKIPIYESKKVQVQLTGRLFERYILKSLQKVSSPKESGPTPQHSFSPALVQNF